MARAGLGGDGVPRKVHAPPLGGSISLDLWYIGSARRRCRCPRSVALRYADQRPPGLRDDGLSRSLGYCYTRPLTLPIFVPGSGGCAGIRHGRLAHNPAFFLGNYCSVSTCTSIASNVPQWFVYKQTVVTGYTNCAEAAVSFFCLPLCVHAP